MSIDLNRCEVNFEATPYDECPEVMTCITLDVNHPEHGSIASLSAYKIDRTACRGSFLAIMDESSSELHQFSVALFDKNGFVRSWLVDGGRRSGTGCWGRELDEGVLIYIMNMSVEPNFRNQGVGSWALGKLVQSIYVDKADTVICWPCPVGGSLRHDKALWDQQQKKQIAFFRKNHFRRIGRTNFFGYSLNPTHPSRNLPAESDAEAQSADHPTEEPSYDDAAARYPLHLAIVNNKTEEIISIIQARYDADPASIHQADYAGFTPIAIALGAVNMPAIRKLLELGVKEDLENFNNPDSMTPLEKLQQNMMSTREFSEALLPNWDGHSSDVLKAEFLTKRVLGMPTMADNENEYVQKRKWGCTCGACAGGWLSPRMRFRLKVQAGLTKDMMEDEMYGFQRGVPHGNPDTLIASSYLPRRLHLAMFKTFYKGYQAIFEYIHNHLSNTNLPLVLGSIMPFDSAVDFYLGKGGKIEYALDALTDEAKDQSPFGDGTFDELWENEDEVGKDFTGIPRCDNDLEFDLVRRMVGLDPRAQWGPYDVPSRQALFLNELGIPGMFDVDMDGDDDDDDDDDD